jgi:DNA (cytosine-5)-methyltransferase 1
MSRKRKFLPAISVFSGAGGMDLGFLKAGFDVRCAVEVDPAACETLISNFPKLKSRLISKPIEQVSTRTILRKAGLRTGEAAIVFGGSPCQSFCIAGNRLGLRDPRGRALLEFLRVVREARPKSFCLENVPGLLSHDEFEAIDLIRKEVNRGSEKYRIAAEILNAAEYGVAQQRRRVFIVGWRVDGDFLFPAPSHYVGRKFVRPWKSRAVGALEALRGLPAPKKPSRQAMRVARTIPARNKKWYT